jgi:hypothetical protein
MAKAVGFVNFPALYHATRATVPLADVRIAGPDGAEAASLFRAVLPAEPAKEVRSRTLDPALLNDGSWQITVEALDSEARHAEVALTLEGLRFLRVTRVEVSDNGSAYALVAHDAAV